MTIPATNYYSASRGCFVAVTSVSKKIELSPERQGDLVTLFASSQHCYYDVLKETVLTGTSNTQWVQHYTRSTKISQDANDATLRTKWQLQLGRLAGAGGVGWGRGCIITGYNTTLHKL